MTSNNSWLAGRNPSLKLFTHLLVMVLLMMIADPVTTLLLWVLSVFIGIFAGGWTLSYLKTRLLQYAVFFLLVFWMLAAFGKGENTIWQWAWFHLTEESVQNGLTIALRMLGFVTYGLLFTSTTDITKFIMSLIHQCRLSPKWAYGLLAGFRFIPLFQTELKHMKAAHKIRGFRPKSNWNGFVRYTLPLLTQGIRKAERIAVAMEARGFTGSRNRTYYQTTTVSFGDCSYSIALFLIALTILLISFYSGWLVWVWTGS